MSNGEPKLRNDHTCDIQYLTTPHAQPWQCKHILYEGQLSNIKVQFIMTHVSVSVVTSNGFAGHTRSADEDSN